MPLIDVENFVFSRVAERFSAEFPNGSRYGEVVYTPAKFPCLTLVESDNYTYERSLTAEMKEHHAWLVYDANAYSNLVTGAKQECQAIMNLVDDEMMSMGFTRVFCTQTRNEDNRIYRMTARYRGVISADDWRMYRK